MLKCHLPRAQKGWGSSSISWIKNKTSCKALDVFRWCYLSVFLVQTQILRLRFYCTPFWEKFDFPPQSCEQKVGLKPGFVTNTSTFTEWHCRDRPSHLRAAKEVTRPAQWVASYDTTGLMHRCLRDLYKFCSWAENCNMWLHLINTSCHQWNKQLCWLGVV